MLEYPIGTGVSHVKATEVSKRAGLSHGAFYHHWASQDDFQDELLEHVLALGRSTDEVASFLHRMANVDPSHPAESLRRAMNSSFEEVDLVPWRLWLALLARNDPGVDLQLGKRYRDLVNAFEPGVASVFNDLGLGLRSPIDVRRLIVLVDALWEGLALRHTVAPDLVDGQGATDEHDRVWSLYALGVAIILLGTLSPDAPGMASLSDAIDRLGITRPA